MAMVSLYEKVVFVYDKFNMDKFAKIQGKRG